MTAYLFFAILQIAASTACLYLVMRCNVSQTWMTISTVLAGVVWFGASLKIALDVFSSDFAFYLFRVVAPYSSGAMLALLILAAILFTYRLVSGQKL